MAIKAIPEGFVLLAQYDERVGLEHKSGPRGDYQRLLRELSKDSPCIAAYKDGGQWVARKSDIEEFLADVARREKPAGGSQERSRKDGGRGIARMDDCRGMEVIAERLECLERTLAQLCQTLVKLVEVRP